MLGSAELGDHSPERDPVPTSLTSPRLPDQVDTPALVVDLDVMDGNIERMQRRMDRLGIALRPHAKTHSSTVIGRQQLDRGARGLTVGTVAMAESFADAGVRDLFLAYPVWAAGPKAARLRALNERADLVVGVDSVEGLDALEVATRGGTRPLHVSIEVDSGEHRTGIHDPGEAAEIALRARRTGVVVTGIFTHGGHAYRGASVVGPAADDEVRCLAETAMALERAGFRDLVVSAGSTPTASRSARSPVTEERPGTYVFGDRQQLALGGCDPDDLALWVVATVVSTGDGWFVLDAGAKVLSKDRPAWLEGHGVIPAYPGARVASLYDFHAVVSVEPRDRMPRVGEVLALLPNHVCPVVNLMPELLCVRAGVIERSIPVDARGLDRRLSHS
jgi:D-serine deaminase-like pyridoxal phosphate-dependent protein